MTIDRRLLAGALGLSLVLAACGGSSAASPGTGAATAAPASVAASSARLASRLARPRPHADGPVAIGDSTMAALRRECVPPAVPRRPGRRDEDMVARCAERASARPSGHISDCGTG